MGYGMGGTAPPLLRLRETALLPAVPALVQAPPPNAVTQSREAADELGHQATDFAAVGGDSDADGPSEVLERGRQGNSRCAG